ncbi:RNA polymerase sigma factor [Citromicrobium bathyomarinum]|uniref:RNA polymerase sigma factor n=1 Tax=Citromicrobium bathyomarinum TaxID=72174 RepID=UPI00315A1949
MTGQQATLYTQAGEQFAPAIARLARAMERDVEKARDLEQDIHLELWRSFERFDGNCALKTWVFRVAHNVAADHAGRHSRRPATVDIDEIDTLPATNAGESTLAESHALTRLHAIIRTLPLLDAQVILLWLEGHSGAEIAEVTGLSTGAVATRLSRLRDRLAAQFELPEDRT